MEDSSLSIAANIAGLLTFVVAILASIYVRYENLHNGKVELAVIYNSVRNKMSDLSAMGMFERVMIEPDDGVEAIWLKKLIASILATEIVIIAYLRYALEISNEASVMSFIYLIPLAGVEPATWKDAIDEAERATARQQLFTSDNIAVRSLQFVLRLGTTPQLVRWYQVRTKVLERIREREDLQSRLLSHQIDMANS